jgi:hypothetical protein
MIQTTLDDREFIILHQNFGALEHTACTIAQLKS